MKFNKLEALRGFASFYVIVYHLLLNTRYAVHGLDLLIPFRFGQEAVILFFLLSGFVIQYSFGATRDKSFGNYFFKRFTRIYIPLSFVFILSYFLKVIEVHNYVNPNWKDLVANLFMLQDVNIKPNVLAPTYMGNVPLWSLSYEWWFYMLFYLLYKFVRPERLRTTVFVIVIISGLTYIFYPFFLNRILFYFGIWWVGVELAKTYQVQKIISTQSFYFSYLLLGVAIFICVINCVVNFKTAHLSFGMSPILELRHFVFSLFVLHFAILWYRFKWVGFNSIFGGFVKLAPISYVLYICHWPILIEREYLNFLSNPLLELVIAIFITILFSYLIERIIYPRLRTLLYNKIERPI